jgi:hypothetical protein
LASRRQGHGSENQGYGANCDGFGPMHFVLLVFLPLLVASATIDSKQVNIFVSSATSS